MRGALAFDGGATGDTDLNGAVIDMAFSKKGEQRGVKGLDDAKK